MEDNAKVMLKLLTSLDETINKMNLRLGEIEKRLNVLTGLQIVTIQGIQGLRGRKVKEADFLYKKEVEILKEDIMMLQDHHVLKELIRRMAGFRKKLEKKGTFEKSTLSRGKKSGRGRVSTGFGGGSSKGYKGKGRSSDSYIPRPQSTDFNKERTSTSKPRSR